MIHHRLIWRAVDLYARLTRQVLGYRRDGTFGRMPPRSSSSTD